VARIALDAMGGDRAPTETVAGGVTAAEEGFQVILVGDETRLKAELAELGSDLPIVHAPEEIGMGDDPARALREKPNSSISVCARMVRDGEADAFVSAGSTGAAMAAAAILIGRLPGVLRPAIAAVFPTPGSATLLLDGGANLEVKPKHIVQFALMGSVMAEVHLGTKNPRVGLLNNGEEPSKGRKIEQEAFSLLEKASINFIGNVEGRDLANAKADVMVTDGFTGNVVLKTVEGAVQMAVALAMEDLARLEPHILEQVMEALSGFRRRLDYEQIGGAHLLGVKGVVVIAHGASSRVAIANAVKMAGGMADAGLVAKVADRIAES
jgi:glycerol-3-phosphate acyltransferase PlsX